MSRKIVLLISIILLLGLSSNVLADPNLVGYWTFDDQSAGDSSGNGYDGTLTGDAAIVNDVERGYVLELDGAGDYVDLGNGGWTNPGDHMTIMAWIKVDAFNAAFQTIVAKGNQAYRLARNDTTNYLDAHINYTSGSFKAIYGNDFSVNDGFWHHVAVTYDGSTMALYIDGEIDGTNSLSTINTNTDILCIGRNADATARDWDGLIDDVSFYNRALDAAEISDSYLDGRDPNILGIWNFDDDTASDSSGFGRDGILVGNAAIVTDGERGQVLELDGSGDYVNLGNGSWTNPGDVMSISAWIKVDAFNASYQTIVAKGNQTYRLSRNNVSNYLSSFVNYNGSSYKSIYGNTYPVNDGSWHHVALTCDGSTMSLYVDGQVDGTNSLSTINTNTDILCIGRNADATARDWQGWIDDVRLYKKALTLDEISVLAELEVTISGSAGLEGVTISGLPGEAVVTDANGVYTATVGYGWDGTVTASLSGYGFSPSTRQYSDITSDQTDQDYTPMPLSYEISGLVGTLDGVTMTGLPGDPVTSGGGIYSATVVYGWSGTVTPEKAGYAFSPEDMQYSDVTADQTNQDYTPALLTYEVSGSIGLDGVTMNGLPGNPVTSGGVYSATVDYGWDGTVSPSKAGYTFSPEDKQYSDVTSDQTSEDYTPTLLTYEISGSIGLDGVTMNGLPGSPVTSGGVYSATVDYGWDGTVTPSKMGYTFNPVYKQYSNVTSDQTGENYSPTLLSYVISGSVGTLDGVTMSGLPGSPVTSGGAYSATVTYGWDGTVTPSKTGYTFNPEDKQYSDVTSDQTSQNYTPTLLTYEISGSIGLDGVTMNGLPGSPVTSGGVYSATVNYGWDGTVTPAKEGYVFSPVDKQYSDVTSDQTSQNYLPTLLTFEISGTVGSLDGVTMDGLPGNPVTSGGAYSATVDYGWSGTVTPSKQYYSFSPIEMQYSNVTSDQTSQNYTPTYDILDVNMLGLWTFDNNNADDSSGYGFDGTFYGDASVVTDAQRGQVLSLDGTGDYVQIVGHQGGITGGASRTVCAWVKTTLNSATPQGIISWGSNSTNDKWDFVVTSTTANQMIYGNTATGSTNVADGNWHHVASVYGGGNLNTVKLYVDGREESVSSPSATPTTGSNYDLMIGGCNGWITRLFYGLLDDVRMYDKALTAAEISELAEAEYMIFGKVIDVDAMYDMNDVTMSGLPGDPVTNSNGYYSATVEFGWSGTVTPSRTGFTFEPSSWEYNNVTNDVNTTDCNATVIRYAISGYVGTLEDVAFPDLPCGVLTDANGFYSCDVDYGWSGTAVPEKDGYTFSPVDRTYSNVTSPQSSENYTATINTYTISGYVGTLEDVVMNGLPGNPATDGNGHYVGTVEYGWNGTVTPILEGYVFEDSSRKYTNVHGDQTGQNYNPILSVLDVNMLGWWTFDNDNSDDESGYGHDGTLVGDANIINDPERGEVLHLDGDGDYVELGNGSWADITDQITIAAWVKVDMFDITYQPILAKGNNTYRLQRANGTDYASLWLNTYPTNSKHADGTTNINDGKWHHVVGVFDGEAMYVYIDGIEDGNTAVASGYIDVTTDNLRIGSNSDNSRYWEGLIDNVRLYDKALTSAQIASLYTSENPGLIGWWKFDGDAKDSSGRGHHGTMVGDVAIVNDAEFGQVLEVGTSGDLTDNWVDCGGGAGDRDWATLGSEMTVMAWVKTDSYNIIYQYILSKGNSFMIGRYSSGDKLRFKTGHWSPPDLIGTTGSNVADSQWHHVAAVYDGAKKYLYIDGKLNASDNCSGDLSVVDDNLLIGGFASYSGRCWKGYIDDVKLFGKALSDTEVRIEAGMLAAEKPSPADGAADIDLDQVLGWRAGPLADKVGGHNVYFGTSFEDVNSRDGSVFMGNQTSNSYNPGMLSPLTTYYWAIDSNNDDYLDSPWAGAVWNFTTVDTNLVGWWNFDDDTASDSSNNGYDGTLTGDAVIVDDAERGNVLKLDGAGDYVNLGNGAWTNPGNDMTISAWIKVGAFNASYQTVLAKGNQTYRLQRGGTSSKMSIYMNYTSGNYKAITGNAIVNDGKWHHVAATYDGNYIKMYVDGGQDSTSNSLSTLYTNSAPLMIGRNSDQTSRDWEGWIDDVRLYNKTLPIEEIRILAGIQQATQPTPVYDKIDIDTYATLSWKPAPSASTVGGHDLYLGTDADLVSTRDASVYVGSLDSNSFETDMLRLATTYYWAVDEVNDAEPMSPWAGDLWRFHTRNSTEGYYKDLFIDGGKGLTSKSASGIPAARWLGYSNEHIACGDTALTRSIMIKTDSGSWQDDNGVMLYPDWEPRFRMIYVNGGQATHRLILEPEGKPWMQSFVYNGGSYTGSCAGAWLTGRKKWDLSPILCGTVGLATAYVDATLPDGVKPYKGKVLPVSPFIREGYYPEYFSDYFIDNIYFNGGCRATPYDSRWPVEKSEAVVQYDMTAVKDGGKTLNLAVNGTNSQRATHEDCIVWAYKEDITAGKEVPCGGHPEGYSGEKGSLQAAIFRYAFSGSGRATVKAALDNGVTRQMNDNDTVGYEKIGDKQYHHFTIEVPEDTSELEIVLDGSMYDMNLYAKLGDFAFAGEPGTIAATNGTGSDETLTISNPQAGTWYIGVKCNTTVTATFGTTNYTYTGNFEVLNGLAYDITASID